MLIEPDKSLHHVLHSLLINKDITIVSATSNHFLFDSITEEKPNLIIMNVFLNHMNGFFWCREIRKQSTIPIIFISKIYSLKQHIQALESGADDYISMPFSTDLFLLKIQSLLRRNQQQPTHKPFIISHNGLTLNTENNTLATENDTIELSKNECQLLIILLRRHGQVVKRETLLRQLWKDERYVDNNTLTVNINRIRKKMKPLGDNYCIQTKVKQGYYIP